MANFKRTTIGVRLIFYTNNESTADRRLRATKGCGKSTFCRRYAMSTLRISHNTDPILIVPLAIW